MKLQPWQARRVHRALQPSLGYLSRLKARMLKVVLFVRRLFIRARGCSEHYVEGAALQNADGALAHRDAC